jgi:hypothetical protein
MDANSDNFKIYWDKLKLNLNGQLVDYPLLRIKISGDPPLVEFIKFMSKIESFTENFKDDYISVTDFTDLKPNKILESVISLSSNSLVRTMTFVSNQSKISFVVLGKDSKLTVLRRRLEDVNQAPDKDAYSYNYRFIEDESSMVEIAQEILDR